MSARKLQQEFDKTNKKIAEGLQLFGEIRDKIFSSEVASQREKLENDLKKELKKLQRSRDQLKQWLGDSSIKLDKNLLQDNRTRIEHAMDQFKELEKSSKIKQFSNEGLELQSQQKRSRFGDDAKYQETCTYINDVISQLQTQNEELDQELDLLGGQSKKKGGSSSMQSSIDDVKYKIERNNTHISKLEEVLENLENDKLDPARVDDIKDDLDYYVENNQDEDYVEYDEFYDQLEVDEDDEIEVEGSLAQMAAETEDEKKKEEERRREEEQQQQQKKKEDEKSTPPKTASSVGTTTNSTTTTNNNNNIQSSSNNSPLTQVKSIGDSQASPASNSSSSTPIKKLKPAVTPAPAPPPITSTLSYSNVIKAAQASANEQQQQQQQQRSVSPPSVNNTVISNNTPTSSTKVLPPGLNHEPVAKSESASPLISHGKLNNVNELSRSQSPMIEHKVINDNISRIINVTQSRLNDPLPLNSITSLLEASLLSCPDSFDAEKPRQYNPINVHPSSIDYPQEPMYELNSSHYMKKFDNDTLFFCFYYGGGGEGIDNIAKYNAAKELSNRGWVFNTEFNQWFMKETHKKNRSMSVIAKEDDQSDDSITQEISENADNYKYFDYEKTWLTRRRENY
ncbi:hypothetical protein G210_5350, partial [Candida maltosa Xu316]